MAGVADRALTLLGLDAARQRALDRAAAAAACGASSSASRGGWWASSSSWCIFGPLVLLLATASGFVYVAAPEPWPVQAVGIVLTGLWLAWIALPLFAFRTNESLDLSRLLVYPLSPRDLVASALLGTLFDGPSYVTLPFFLAILVGWFDQPWLLPVALAAILLAYALMMVTGQLVLTASMGLLRSRRFRDLWRSWCSRCWGRRAILINRLVETWARASDVTALRTLEPLLALRWLPPGACAQALAVAGQGDWPGAMLWLGYAAAWLALLIWAWWKLLLRMTTGAATWSLPAPKAAPARRPINTSDAIGAIGFAWLPAPARAMLVKEFKLTWRVPQRRIGLLQSVLAPFALIAAIFFGEMEALSRLPEWIAAGLPAIMLFAAWGLSTNMLGMESRGLATLLLTPAPRQQLLLGKGLAYTLMALAPTAIYAAVLAAITRSPLVVVGLLAGIGTALVVVAVNMMASVYFSYPFDENSTVRQRTGGGWQTGVVQIVVVPLTMAAIVAPTTLPMLVGVWWGLPLAVTVLGTLAGLTYALILFGWTTYYAGKVLTAREAETLAAASLAR
jgi:ABC-2 type transport system permease protein